MEEWNDGKRKMGIMECWNGGRKRIGNEHLAFQAAANKGFHLFPSQFFFDEVTNF